MLTAGRVVVVGGYGTFGSRAAERLARHGDVSLVIAGRSAASAAEAARQYAAKGVPAVEHAVVDAERPDLDGLRALKPDVILNASGPFQSQSYALAEAAISVRAHYVDLADGRAFVTGIDRLDAAAKSAGILVASGASSVPALVTAVIDDRIGSFAQLTGIDYGIVPSGDFDPGLATTHSILGYVGKPFATRRHGRQTMVHGWQGVGSHVFPGIGRRWLGYCDIPDLDLLPRRYPSLQTVTFRAGLAMPAMHFGLWGLSWLARARLLQRPERLAPLLLAVKRRLAGFGGDTGAMFVTLQGTGLDGQPKAATWHLLAPGGRGPYVPPTPAVIIARKLLKGEITARGAMPALGLMTLGEFAAETADLGIVAGWTDA